MKILESFGAGGMEALLKRKVTEIIGLRPGLSPEKALATAIQNMLRAQKISLEKCAYIDMRDEKAKELQQLLEHILDRVGVSRADLVRYTNKGRTARYNTLNTSTKANEVQGILESYDNNNNEIARLAQDMADMQAGALQLMDALLHDNELFTGKADFYANIVPRSGAHPNMEAVLIDIIILIELLENSQKMMKSVEGSRSSDVQKDKATKRAVDKKITTNRWWESVWPVKSKGFFAPIEFTSKSAFWLTGRMLIEIWYRSRQIRDNVTAHKKLK